MSDSAETASFEAVGPEAGQPAAASAGASWTPNSSAQPGAAGLAAEHPEVLVGAAFAGGLVLAKILKRFAA